MSLVLPFNPKDTKAGRIDQGWDLTSASPFLAIGSGRVVHIDPNFYNGTPAVYIKLDQPVSVNGRTYDAVYYSETAALVRVGQRVQAGQPVTGPGNGEIGFARRFGVGWLPAAHFGYREGSSTQAGGDFETALKDALQADFTKQVQASDPLGQAAHAVASPFESIGHLIGVLSSGAFWVRALEVVGGGILVLVGLYLLARNVGLAATPPAPIRQGAELSDEAAAEMHFSPGRAAYRGPRRQPQRSAELGEAAVRRRAIRERSERAEPSGDIPF